MRLINWIWHVRGSLELAPGQSGNDAFDKLAPLFDETGTSHERTSDTLTFSKKDQPAQDKMSVFDSGVLRIEKGAAGSLLQYHLVSRALLFCFLLVPLFLGIAQLTILVGKSQKPATEAAAGKAADASKKPAEKAVVPKLNPIDKFLGAPAPEAPKKGEEKLSRRGGKPSPTSAYVFASFFAILYVVGRILEAWLVKRLFRRRLAGS
ncbi:MAG: hypothetical protein JF628_00500 [Sphingomonas sp.]|nr:hypothetical protein [Sphingomonas sp.]